MPPVHGSKARMFFDGWDITGVMRDASFPSEVDVADSSTWGMTSKRYTPDDRVNGTLTGGGVWEGGALGAGSIDELLGLSPTGVHVATWLPQGEGFGNRGRAIGGMETSYEPDSPGDDVTGFTFEMTSVGGLIYRARSLQPLAGALNITANGNGASLDDLGAAGTTLRGAGAALHVINKGGGAGTLTVKVQHSPDQSVWTDLITFGGKTVKNVAEYAETALGVTVQRYLRALWTLTGGTWDISVVAGRK